MLKLHTEETEPTIQEIKENYSWVTLVLSKRFQDESKLTENQKNDLEKIHKPKARFDDISNYLDGVESFEAVKNIESPYPIGLVMFEMFKKNELDSLLIRAAQ
ncbi:hypothetical protein BP5796_08244 [Coleophoma crateriformis]|uniref:Uncharacterized protein n=1 Tax=Coleophoma crateriformis TaxID=565419 RepID=A0A3D8RE04_9HELO|nr:hypothetical protein BP5796_08244 [Coleophoma crateriformis]